MNSTFYEFIILLCRRSARRQNASSFAVINCGKGEPSLSMARKGRSSVSARMERSRLFFGSVFSFSSRFIVSLRIDSERRLGMQPNGPMAITPQESTAISDMELPIVRMASPVKFSDMYRFPLLMIDLTLIG